MKKIIEKYDLMLSGVQYLDKFNNSRYDNAEGSRAGTIFELHHEKDNLYDPLAIMVLHKGKDIGYIPKDENLEIAYYLSHPEQFVVECRQKKKNIRNDFEMIVVFVSVFAITDDYTPFSFEVFDEEFPNYDADVEALARKRRMLEVERELIEQEERERLRLTEDKGHYSAITGFEGCLIVVAIVLIILLLKTCD
ncbi:hypothetical protein D1000_07100 [Riemerella anatipestifer]|uniref:HIRAN domain-containing protein n=2 Tax=Riemerella anatipestifer TaxID=34085 RepID=UPI002856FB9A|nr:HIRAN domain-containing protein [Riemerella anatipestifer]MDR7695101.1 hypothetical protein [Riemerella anatipestifer]MDR7795242.1 hypothetical protein [Riemerella anatipestifer]MRN16585.1 hypothetical protein [Riemerella anatipestifer]